MDNEPVEIPEKVQEEGVSVFKYLPTQEANRTDMRAYGSLEEHRNGLSTVAVTITKNSVGLFPHTPPAFELVGDGRRNNDGQCTRQVLFKKIKGNTKSAELGTLPLLYYEGENQEPYDVRTMIEVIYHRRSSGSSENPKRSVQRMTWKMHSNRRLFTDNLLLGIGTLFQQ